MSADKYAQFIAEQQRKLSVSGVNAVELQEKKELSAKQKKIAAQAGDPEKIEGEDFAKLRAQKEEVEKVDEVRAIQGKHASVAHKAPSISPSRVKYKGKGSKPKVQTDLNIMASYEIDAEEMMQIDEAVKGGKTKELMDFYNKGMAVHKDKMDHHMSMAKMCADCGDDDGWYYHTDRAAGHKFEHDSHKSRADRVAGLAAKVKDHEARAEMHDKLNKLSRNP